MVAQTRHYATCLGIVEIGYLFELSAVRGDDCIGSERERREECKRCGQERVARGMWCQR